MRFVVYANAVVSGVLRLASKPERILDSMLSGELSYVVSTELVEEYRELLKRPKFGLDAALVEALADGLAEGAGFPSHIRSGASSRLIRRINSLSISLALRRLIS